MLSMCFGHGCSFQGQAWMDRHPFAVSAATGSVSSTLLWILKDFAFGDSGLNVPLDLGCPVHEPPPLNFITGLIAGFLLWPALEKFWFWENSGSFLALKLRLASLACKVDCTRFFDE